MTETRDLAARKGHQQRSHFPISTPKKVADPVRHGIGLPVSVEDIGFPFLDLPVLVRARCYMFMFAPKGTLDLMTSHAQWAAVDVAPVINILFTCWFIHKEATTILYGLNKFVFGSSTGNIKSWLKQIGRRNARRVRTICMDFIGSCDHGKDELHVEDYTSHIEVLRLAPNCYLEFQPHHDERSYPSYRFGCQPSHKLDQIETTLQKIRDESIVRNYERLKLVKKYLLYESGKHGAIVFKTSDPRLSWKQEFLVRDADPTIKQETNEFGDVTTVAGWANGKEGEERETFEFLYRRKGFSDLPTYLIVEILKYVLRRPRIIEKRLPPGSEGQDAYTEFSNFEMLPEKLPFPRGVLACKRLYNQALHMYYTRNTFVFRFRFTRAKVGHCHNLEYVFRWIEKCEHRRHAGQVRIVLDFGRNITLHEIYINIFAHRPEDKKKWNTSLDIFFCFEAAGVPHGVSMDQIARNISKFLYSQDGDTSLDRCLVDGYGNARPYLD